jgi:hypothetical protein
LELPFPYGDDDENGMYEPLVTEPEERRAEPIYEEPVVSDVEPVIEPFIEDVPRYKKLKEELLHKIDDAPMYHKYEEKEEKLEELPFKKANAAPPYDEFADEPLHLEPEKDEHEYERRFRDEKREDFYEPADDMILAEPEPETSEPAGAVPDYSIEEDVFYGPVRSNYFDGDNAGKLDKPDKLNKKPASGVFVDVEDYAKPFFDDPMAEPSPDEAAADTKSTDTPWYDSPEDGFFFSGEAASETEDREENEKESYYEPPPPQDPPSYKLKRLMKSLRLDFADLAFLFQVSLPMVRTWFSGVMFGAEEEMQLQYFLEVADMVDELDVPRFDLAVRHPMPDGGFFLEKVKDREICEEKLKMLMETAERADELRRKFKGAAKPFHDMQHAIGLYATPLHCEG